MRDVRDYRIHSTAENRLVLGGSAFNIKSESLRLGDFSEQEIRALTAQHTAHTGQEFTEGALELIVTRTGGQPWLVNALCYDACFRHKPGRDRARPITADAILEAQERLILRRDTHIDDLGNKLRDERVRRVIEPILAGADRQTWSSEDVAYAHDLGLVAQDAGGRPHIANPIYAEVVPRHLNHAVQIGLPQPMAWYLDAAGNLDVEGLIAAFQAFFREHSEHWVQRFERYHEAGPQLLLQAHLQRIVNGGGAHRAGVRAGAGADRPADRVAPGRAGAALGGGVQGTARGPGARHRGGHRPDARLCGSVRGGGGPPDRVRPLPGAKLGAKDLPPRSAARGRRAGHGLGHVTLAMRVDELPIARSRFAAPAPLARAAAPWRRA